MTEPRQGEIAARKEDTHPEARRQGREPLVPLVDIYENDEGIILLADMPGVSKDGLDIHVDKNTLTIRGAIAGIVPKDVKPLYAEFDGRGYQRVFTLGPDVDVNNIRAVMSGGVLKLVLPKTEAVKPRRIEVKAA